MLKRNKYICKQREKNRKVQKYVDITDDSSILLNIDDNAAKSFNILAVWAS